MTTRSAILWLLAAVLCLPAPLAAQVSGGTIVGTVQDDTGAILPGVTIVITNMGTAVTREIVTDDRGQYEARALQPGRYEVRATLTGFRTLAQTGVVVQVNQETRVNLTMQLGAVAEMITVQGEGTVVQTTTATVGKVVEQQQIVALPLSGRNFVDLGLLIPGVTTRTQSAQATDRYYVHGQRDDANNFLLDGVTSVELEGNASDVRPNPDAVQEFKIQTSNFSAEFGRNAGSIVQVVTKSGTNEFHGTGWEFNRDDAFQSRDFFARTDPPPLKQNQFGAAFGGPVMIPGLYSGRNRTFFFGTYEGFRQTRGVTRQTVLATAQERAGDFSFLSRQLIDPETGGPFPGNVIPPEKISPAARALLSLMPLPNIPGTSPRQNNFVASPESTSKYNQVVARIDQTLGENWTVFYRHFQQKNEVFSPYQGAGVAGYLGFPNVFDPHTRHMTGGLNTVFSASLLNELRTGVYLRKHLSTNLPYLNPVDFGVGYVRPQDVIGGLGLPEFNITGMSGIGNQIQGPSSTDNYEFQLTDVLTKQFGRHHLKLGGELRKGREDIDVGFFFVGRFVFDGRYTGDSFADFLLGRAREFNFAGGRTRMVQNNFNAGWFVQDDFKITDRLTLNLGIRWDYYSPITDRLGRTSTFVVRTEADPNRPRSGEAEILIAGDQGYGLPEKGTYFPDKNNYQPRVGFSWNVRGDGTLAVRGGGGVFHNQLRYNTTLQQLLSYPFYYQPVIRDTTLADPLKGGRPEDFATAPLNPTSYTGPPIGQLYVTDPDIVTPYTIGWSLGAQWEFARNTLVELAYVGNGGRKLLQFREMNQPVFVPGQTTQANKDQFRRYPGFTSVLRTTNWGSSNYHGLEISAQRRFTGGLGFQAAWTWSKSLDYSSHFHSGATNTTWVMTPQDDDNRDADYGPSFFDARHRLVLSELWELPIGPGKRWLTDGMLSQVVGGWMLNTIWSFQSGRPFSPYDGADPCVTAGNWTPVCRPNLVGDPNAGPKTPQGWFNTDAFQRTATGQFGNAGRNLVIGPGLANVDMSLIKLVQVGRLKFEIRAEAFNLFNRVNFGIPVVDIASAAFGRIGSTATPAREWQFGVKVSF